MTLLNTPFMQNDAMAWSTVDADGGSYMRSHDSLQGHRTV